MNSKSNSWIQCHDVWDRTGIRGRPWPFWPDHLRPECCPSWRTSTPTCGWKDNSRHHGGTPFQATSNHQYEELAVSWLYYLVLICGELSRDPNYLMIWGYLQYPCFRNPPDSMCHKSIIPPPDSISPTIHCASAKKITRHVSVEPCFFGGLIRNCFSFIYWWLLLQTILNHSLVGVHNNKRTNVWNLFGMLTNRSVVPTWICFCSDTNSFSFQEIWHRKRHMFFVMFLPTKKIVYTSLSLLHVRTDKTLQGNCPMSCSVPACCQPSWLPGLPVSWSVFDFDSIFFNLPYSVSQKKKWDFKCSTENGKHQLLRAIQQGSLQPATWHCIWWCARNQSFGHPLSCHMARASPLVTAESDSSNASSRHPEIVMGVSIVMGLSPKIDGW